MTSQHRTSHRASRRRALTATSVGLAVAVLLGSAAPSNAESVVVADHAKDVWHVDQGEDGTIYGYRKVGGAVNVNIISTTVRHRDRSVLILTEYRSLTRRDGLYYLYQNVRTDVPREFGLSVQFGSSHPEGLIGIYDRDAGVVVDCENLSVKVDYAADTLRTTIPRGCLGMPETVSANGEAFGRNCCDDHKVDPFDRPGHGPVGWSPAVRAG